MSHRLESGSDYRSATSWSQFFTSIAGIGLPSEPSERNLPARATKEVSADCSSTEMIRSRTTASAFGSGVGGWGGASTGDGAGGNTSAKLIFTTRGVAHADAYRSTPRRRWERPKTPEG